MADEKCEKTVRLWHSYLEVQKNILQCIQESARREDLSVQQYLILVTFSDHGEISQKTVREKTFLPKSTLSEAIEGLVKDEIIIRKPLKSDRREIGLLLSDKGMALVQKIQTYEPGILQTFSSVVTEIPNSDFEKALAMNEQITMKLQKEEGKSKC